MWPAINWVWNFINFFVDSTFNFSERTGLIHKIGSFRWPFQKYRNYRLSSIVEVTKIKFTKRNSPNRSPKKATKANFCYESLKPVKSNAALVHFLIIVQVFSWAVQAKTERAWAQQAKSQAKPNIMIFSTSIYKYYKSLYEPIRALQYDPQF